MAVKNTHAEQRLLDGGRSSSTAHGGDEHELAVSRRLEATDHDGNEAGNAKLGDVAAAGEREDRLRAVSVKNHTRGFNSSINILLIFFYLKFIILFYYNKFFFFFFK